MTTIFTVVVRPGFKEFSPWIKSYHLIDEYNSHSP